MRKPVVGETLYALNVGNAAYHREQVLTPVEVTQVGRKYFKCKHPWHYYEIQFYLDSWHQATEYSADIRLYESPQEWEDDKERKELMKLLEQEFRNISWVNSKKFSLEKLRQICELLKNE